MSIKLNSASGGSVTIIEPSTASDFTITAPEASGNLVLNPVIAGTSSQPPLIFTPGTNLTVPYTGAMEYDGTTLLYTPIDAQRGLIPGMQFYSHALIGRTGENSTANQSLLGVGCTVTANTLYQFQGRFNLFKTAGTTSHTFGFSWGGTAGFRNNRIVTNMLIQSSAQGYSTQNTARAVYNYVMETPSTFAFSGAIASAFYTINMQVDGMFIANNSGTIIPQYALSAAPGGAYTASAGNYLAVWPVNRPDLSANITANVSIGTWS